MTQFWMKALRHKAARDSVYGLVCAFILSIGLLGAASSARADITTQYATMTRQSDGVYALNADFRLNMPQQLQDAINHGTPVSFQVEFRINRPRWYWSNENLVSTSREQRISFNSLTREYRFNSAAN